MADEVTIKPLDNGPLLVTGGATVIDASGRKFEMKDTIALCRCGNSANKPFCDGTHNKIEFKSEVRAQ